MKINNLNRRFQPAFTLVEVLMALVLFSLTFFFVTQFFKIAYSRELLKDDTTVRLAINEIDNVISQKDFQPVVWKNVRHWKVKTSTTIDEDLVFIKVEIFPLQGNSPVYHLETYRILDN